jgi:serine O-acetyltransferase
VTESAAGSAQPLSQPAPPSPAQADRPPRPRHWRLRNDLEKYYFIILGTTRPRLHRKVKAWIWNFELHLILLYRFGQLAMVLWEKSKLLGALPLAIALFFQYLSRVVFHLEIPLRCRIGPAFHLGHPYGIILGPTEIGANCNVTHGVTIGMGLAASGRGVPTLGDNVWIGPGSILTGPIHIGDGATVSAGSVLARDVPPRALVAGNPARVINADFDNTALLGYTMPAPDTAAEPPVPAAPAAPAA